MKNLIAAAILTAALLFTAAPAKAEFNIYDTTTASTLTEAQYVTATSTNTAVAVNTFIGKSVIIVSAAPKFILTTSTNTVTIQDCAVSTASSTGWTNISGLSYAFWTNSVQAFAIEPGAQKKYIRVISTIAGTNEFGTTAVMIGRPKYLP